MKGIIADFLGIFFGCICGNIFFSNKKLSSTFSALCGIIISMMSVVGFFTSVIYVDGKNLKTSHLVLAIICLVVGTAIGEMFSLETRIYNSKILKISSNGSKWFSAVINGTFMFAIGGMAIVGPLEAFLKDDCATLYLKAFIDFTISLSLGGALGKIVAFSAFPVAFIEMIFGLISLKFSGLFTTDVVNSLCCVGYIILFFSGFNFIFENVVKIKTINMMPSIGLVFLYRIAIYILKLFG